MNDLRTILISVIGVVIFIALLPALLWLFVIVMVLIAIFVIYSRIKYNRYMKDVQKEFGESPFFNANGQEQPKQDNRIDKDVIDVEYTESDDDQK